MVCCVSLPFRFCLLRLILRNRFSFGAKQGSGTAPKAGSETWRFSRPVADWLYGGPGPSPMKASRVRFSKRRNRIIQHCGDLPAAIVLQMGRMTEIDTRKKFSAMAQSAYRLTLKSFQTKHDSVQNGCSCTDPFEIIAPTDTQ